MPEHPRRLGPVTLSTEVLAVLVHVLATMSEGQLVVDDGGDAGSPLRLAVLA
jgi:hypothetical protein